MRSRAQDQLMHVNDSDEEHLESFRVLRRECQEGISKTSTFEKNEVLVYE